VLDQGSSVISDGARSLPQRRKLKKSTLQKAIAATQRNSLPYMNEHSSEESNERLSYDKKRSTESQPLLKIPKNL
jgi:hypothetical protein